jgi:site-specific DNA-methyltransferase (adenine-specific)
VKPAVIRGDALHLPLPDGCVDAIITDPPYGLEFMGREWDAPWKGARRDGFHTARNPASADRDNVLGRLSRHSPEYFAGPAFGAWCQQVGAELLRVAKPGAHLAAFGGTRTWHRLVVGLEDAGWEIRDTLMWLYGSGFPKSLDVSKAIDRAAGVEREDVYDGRAPVTDNAVLGKGLGVGLVERRPVTAEAAAWDGWGTSLKPSYEPVVLARKPLTGTVAANVQAHGVGALNIDACRIAGEPWVRPGGDRAGTSGGIMGKAVPREPSESNGEGRWPANLLLDTDTARLLDQHAGASRSSGIYSPSGTGDTHIGTVGFTARDVPATMYGDSGGPSRFYYTAKAGRADRIYNRVCDCQTDKLDGWDNEDPPTATRPARGTSPPRATTASNTTDAPDSPTTSSGNKPTAPSPPDTRSTTATATSSTTGSTTSNSSPPPSTSASTPGANDETASGGNPATPAASTSPSPSTTGTSAAKAGPSTGAAAPATSRRSSNPNACGDCGAEYRVESHPTTKPVDLMRWLIRLITPRDGLILDPFAGSGTTGQAAEVEGRRCVLVERDPGYTRLIQARIDRPAHLTLDLT